MRVKLKDVCTFYTGTGFPKKYQGQLSGTYPFYKVGDIANNVVSGKVYLEQCNNYISEETLELIKGSIIPKNTIVFAKIGEALKLNRRAITSTDCLIDNNAMGIAAKSDKLRTLFFYYFMRNIKMELLAESTTVPSVRKSRLEAYEIDIPSLDDQKIIEGKLTILSKVINLKEKQLLKLDELVKARFVEMFGDENNSKGWEIVNIEDVVNVQVGVVIKPSQYYTNRYNGIKAFRSLNIGNGYIKDDDWVYFSKEGNKKNKKSILSTNDVLVVRSGAPGTACVVTSEYAGSNAIDVIIAHPDFQKVDSHYLCTYTNMPHGKSQIIEGTGGAAQQHFNVGKYNKLKLMLPPLEYQKQYVKFLEEIDKSRSRIQKSLEASQELFDSLMQEYFG